MNLRFEPHFSIRDVYGTFVEVHENMNFITVREDSDRTPTP